MNSSTPAAISRPFGFTEPNRLAAIGVSAKGTATTARPPTRYSAVAASAHSRAHSAAETSRASTTPVWSGHTSSGRPTGR